MYTGTVDSVHPASPLVSQGRCLYCVPSSYASALPGAIWRPLTEPVSPVNLWRAADDLDHVRAAVACARTMSERLGWLITADRTTG